MKKVKVKSEVGEILGGGVDNDTTARRILLPQFPEVLPNKKHVTVDNNAFTLTRTITMPQKKRITADNNSITITITITITMIKSCHKRKVSQLITMQHKSAATMPTKNIYARNLITSFLLLYSSRQCNIWRF